MKEHQGSCYLLPFHKGAFDTVMQAAMNGNSHMDVPMRTGR